MHGIKIEGTGMCVPEKIVTNNDFSKFLDTSDEWITERTGIKERRIANGEPVWWLAQNAANEALKNAGVAPEEIDVIFVSSCTSDYITPSLSCIIQGKINAVNAFCIDINCACAGFVYALDLASKQFHDPSINKILIVASEELSRITNYEDRTTCVLFGDGAGAVVVSRSDLLFASHLGSNGQGIDKLYAHGTKSENPFMTESTNEYETLPEWPRHKIYMDGKEVYKFASRIMSEAVEKACDKAGILVSDLDWVIPHQANIRIINIAAQRLSLPLEKMFVNLEKYGNTSSASIPICLAEMNKQGLLKRGQKIAVVGFGAGLTYGCSVFEY